MTKFLAIVKRVSARAFSRTSATPEKAGGGVEDGLLAFQAEDGESTMPRRERRGGSPKRGLVVVAAIVLGLVSATIVYIANSRVQAARPGAPAVAATPSGMAMIDSNPSGTVTIDNVVRGRTPLSLQLPAGPHTMVVTAGQNSRSLPLDIEAGVNIRQHVEFTSAPAPTTGRLEVTSEPSGARVNVDGTPKGTTPLSIADIAAGPHQLTITSGEMTTRRRVTIVAGALASVDASLAASGEAATTGAGWLALTSPVELTLAEDDQIVGTTKAARLMLPAGNHNIVLSNAALEYQATMPVRIDGGKTLKRPVTLPNGSLSINAVPWANVSVDGSDLGTTPLANVPLPIGSHEIVWRHPQLGERRRTVSVTARTPTRVGMDFK